MSHARINATLHPPVQDGTGTRMAAEILSGKRGMPACPVRNHHRIGSMFDTGMLPGDLPGKNGQVSFH